MFYTCGIESFLKILFLFSFVYIFLRSCCGSNLINCKVWSDGRTIIYSKRLLGYWENEFCYLCRIEMSIDYGFWVFNRLIIFKDFPSRTNHREMNSWTTIDWTAKTSFKTFCHSVWTKHCVNGISDNIHVLVSSSSNEFTSLRNCCICSVKFVAGGWPMATTTQENEISNFIPKLCIEVFANSCLTLQLRTVIFYPKLWKILFDHLIKTGALRIRCV